MARIQPIQIIGTQRSGSNLLRLMLNQFEEITAPHPPHILQRFMPLLPFYGNLQEEANFWRLTNDVCTLVERNPVVWAGIELNRGQLIAQCKSNSLFEIFRVIYDLKAGNDQASFWACKSMANIQYAEELEVAGIRPRYIHLFRDGRDVACSFRKAIVGEKHVYHIAKQWARNQEACLALKSQLGAERFIQVSYEDLIESPENEMKRISSFLGLSFNPAVFDFYKSEESKNTAGAGQMWANVSKPILKGNSKKYRKELSELDIAIFEKQAGNMLLALNYALENNGMLGSAPFSEAELSKFNLENNRLKQEASLAVDPEGMKLRQPQEELLRSIRRQELVAL